MKTLFAMSNNVCAMPGCEAKLTNPRWNSVRARICHIRAVSAGGPRFDAAYPDPNAYENLLLLCPSCHNLVDDLEPEEWPVERLEDIKQRHESRAAPPSRWTTDRDLARFARQAIELSMASPMIRDSVTSTIQRRAELVLRPRRDRSSTSLVIVNEGDSVAYAPSVEQADGEGAFALGASGPGSIPPKGEWVAGHWAPTFGNPGPHELRIRWQDESGDRHEVVFPVS